MNCYIDQREREYLADLARCENEAQAEDDVINEMMGKREHVDDFLAYTGTDVATVLARLLTQGLPSRDGSEGDNRHIDLLVTELDRLREEFEHYARTPIHRESPLRAYMDRRQEDAL